MTKFKSPAIATALVTGTRSKRYPEKVPPGVPLPDVLVGMLESVSHSESVRSAETIRRVERLSSTAIWCKWLAHGPLKAEIRVRVPVSLPNLKKPNKKNAKSALGLRFRQPHPLIFPVPQYSNSEEKKMALQRTVLQRPLTVAEGQHILRFAVGPSHKH
jgi:hypothetical protein